MRVLRALRAPRDSRNGQRVLVPNKTPTTCSKGRLCDTGDILLLELRGAQRTGSVVSALASVAFNWLSLFALLSPTSILMANGPEADALTRNASRLLKHSDGCAAQRTHVTRSLACSGLGISYRTRQTVPRPVACCLVQRETGGLLGTPGVSYSLSDL